MRDSLRIVVVSLALLLAAVFAVPEALVVDVPVGSAQAVTTATGAGVHSSFGSADEYFAVFRLFPVVPGKRYEATLTYDAGGDMGYGLAWMDGNPATRDWANFVGIGSGTGTREMKGAELKYLFSVAPQSSSNVLYVLVRSAKPWPIRFALTDRPTGVTPDSQNRWGYYYVSDFDADKYAPFLLSRGGVVSPPAAGGPTSSAVRLIGPLAFSAGKAAGTLRLLQFSEKEGVAWLRVEGTGVEEILNVVFKAGELKFVRTVDCRLGASQAYAQVFTGRIALDGTLAGSFARDDEPSLSYPWRAGH